MNKYIIGILIITGFLTSCSEDRLDLSPISQENASNFYKTPEEIEQAVGSAYDGLQSNGEYGQNFIYNMEVRSDISRQLSTTNSGGIYGDIDLFRVDPSNSVIDGIWSSCYNGIQRCNIVLNRIESVDNNPNKNIQIGEVKFIRALTYFNLVRLFGDVPLVTVEYTDPFEAFDLGRTPMEEVYDQIIKDLTEASASLENSALRTGGATKNAANALLGKVHLTLGNTSEAITVLNSVSGVLLPNYSDIFGVSNENNAESIFEIQYKAGGIGEGSQFANLFATEVSQVGGVGVVFGDNLPTWDLYNSYDPSDLRRDINIGTDGSGILYNKKYMDVPVSDRDADNNFIVLRYADVVLMLAEALNEKSYEPDGEAFDLLNNIRRRANLTELTSVELSDQASFREAIANERKWELCFESHRWFDLIRTGKAIEVMNAHSSLTGTLEPVTSNNLIFPIPLSQVDATNGKITQNPGY